MDGIESLLCPDPCMPPPSATPSSVPPVPPGVGDDGAAAGFAASGEPMRSDSGPLADDVEWFAGLFEPLAGLAIARGAKLPALIDSLKLALVRAALAEPAGEAASDSRLAVMTGVHRKDLRRIRTTGSTARPKRRSLAGEVFARWQSEPRFLTARGRPRVLRRQAVDAAQPSFEELVAGISRDVHPRPVLDELMRLRMVETLGADEQRVRLLRTSFVPATDSAQMRQLALDNLADHCAAIAGNLAGDGARFLEQAIYSDGLTAESARQFNRETLAVWEAAFATMMPRLQALFEADRTAEAPRDHRVRLGMYGFAAFDRDKR
jgi:hypothetical protein